MTDEQPKIEYSAARKAGVRLFKAVMAGHSPDIADYELCKYVSDLGSGEAKNWPTPWREYYFAIECVLAHAGDLLVDEHETIGEMVYRIVPLVRTVQRTS